MDRSKPRSRSKTTKRRKPSKRVAKRSKRRTRSKRSKDSKRRCGGHSMKSMRNYTVCVMPRKSKAAKRKHSRAYAGNMELTIGDVADLSEGNYKTIAAGKVTSFGFDKYLKKRGDQRRAIIIAMKTATVPEWDILEGKLKRHDARHKYLNAFVRKNKKFITNFNRLGQVNDTYRIAKSASKHMKR
jgi:hypothetical protein